MLPGVGPRSAPVDEMLCRLEPGSLRWLNITDAVRDFLGLTLDQLRHVKRAVAVAGGKRKREAIRAALAGGLVNVLITDRFTAQHLIDGRTEQQAAAAQAVVRG